MKAGWQTMSRFLFVVLVVYWSEFGFSQTTEMTAAQAFLGKYCIGCHSIAQREGEREFESLDFSKDHLQLQIQLQEIIDQITLGAMPPENEEQPTAENRVQAIEQLTELLTRMRERSTSTGAQTVLRRLTRREYRNTVRDLLGIDMTVFDPTVEFPADNLSNHFDNIGDALVTSGYLLEKYLDAADSCIEKALTPVVREPREWVFKDRFLQQQELNAAHRYAHDNKYLILYDHPLNDKPEGAYGPLLEMSSGVPADGIYEIKVLAQALHRDSPYKKETIFIDLDEPFRLGVRPGNTAIGDMAHMQPIQPLLAEATLKDNDFEWYTFKVHLDKGYSPRFTFENGMHDVRGAYNRVLRNHNELLPPEARKSTGIVEARKSVMKFGALPQIRIQEVRLTGPCDVTSPTRSEQILLSGNRLHRVVSENCSATLLRVPIVALPPKKKQPTCWMSMKRDLQTDASLGSHLRMLSRPRCALQPFCISAQQKTIQLMQVPPAERNSLTTDSLNDCLTF